MDQCQERKWNKWIKFRTRGILCPLQQCIWWISIAQNNHAPDWGGILNKSRRGTYKKAMQQSVWGISNRHNNHTLTWGGTQNRERQGAYTKSHNNSNKIRATATRIEDERTELAQNNKEYIWRKVEVRHANKPTVRLSIVSTALEALSMTQWVHNGVLGLG